MKSSSVLVLSAVALLGSLVFTPKSVAQQPPSDANIGAIVLAANQIDIDYGKLALTKSKNKEVLDFAQQMITDHGAVQKSVRYSNERAPFEHAIGNFNISSGDSPVVTGFVLAGHARACGRIRAGRCSQRSTNTHDRNP
jgi:Domain of unknown function (DUF4142)